jgi:transketolase C-terminal domain/subunit
VKELAKRWEEHTKGMLLPGTLFEEFGFNYIGPIDGHDVDTLARTLANVKELQGAAAPARDHEEGLGLRARRGGSDPLSRRREVRSRPSGYVAEAEREASYTQIFGDWICDIAAADPRVVAITPAMREGSGSCASRRNIPSRYFDVGIAEQHAVTFAAGLACEGMKPVVAIYSTFLQRAYDQLIHDVALQNLPVVFAIDRARHRRRRRRDALRRVRPDLSALRAQHDGDGALRRERVPADALHRVHARHADRGALSARYGPGCRGASRMTALPIGKGEVRRTTSRRTNRIAIMAFGSMVAPALAAGEELDATVANMRFVKPLDTELVCKLAHEHDALVTIEENVDRRRRGSAVAEALAAAGIVVSLLQLGLPDAFVDHGDPARLLADAGSTRADRIVDQRAIRTAPHRSARETGGLTRLAQRTARHRPADKIAVRRLEFPCARSRSSVSPPQKGRRISPSGSTRTASRGSSSRSTPVPLSRAIRALSPGIGMMGGPMSVNDALAWTAPLGALLRNAVDAAVPVLGHCLGGQMFAQALGAPVTRTPTPESAGSRSLSNDAARDAWFGGPRIVRRLQWHYDVFALPPARRAC